MIKQYSIAEARNHFAAIVHNLKTSPLVHVTRRGKPVAVLLAIEEYEQLAADRMGFWESYELFQASANLAQLGIEPAIFTELRDRSPGREVIW